jgi:hypothetical protein
MEFEPTLWVRCLHNDDYKGSLTVGRVYPAAEAEHGLVRIVDDSEEAYYYSMHHFEVVHARV